MPSFFKDKNIKVDPATEYYTTLYKALHTTMHVCIASTSALEINHLTAKIHPDRMAQYQENSLIAVSGLGKIRTFLMKVSKYLETKNVDFIDATAPVKHIISESRVGNCEHQSFYLATLLRQQGICAYIYNIEDIDHSVVITKDYLLDPWLGRIFLIKEIDFCEFYDSSLGMKASWLNHLLSYKELFFHKMLNIGTLNYYFGQQDEGREVVADCCTIL